MKDYINIKNATVWTKLPELLVLAALILIIPGIPESDAQTADFPLIYEAENATLNGVTVNDDVQEFSGNGYVAEFDQAGDFIEFNISVPRQDYYTLRFQFLNGDTTPAVRTLLLDGVKVPGTARFRNTALGFSGEWLALDESLRLTEGSHTVTLAFRETNDMGDVLIDSMQLLDTTRPSATSARSLLMNNWTDMVAIHHSAKLTPADTSLFGPRLAAIHYKSDWPTNQIDGATAYFRDDTDSKTFTDLHRFDSNLYFTSDGIMHVDYLNYGEAALPVSITKQYAMVPEEPILLARYSLSNRSNRDRSISMMELVDLNNLSMGNPSGNPGDTAEGGANGAAGQQISVTWYPDYNAWIADMSQTNGTYLVFGAYASERSHAAGTPAAGQPLGKDSALLKQFEGQGILQNNAELTADDIILTISNSASLGAGNMAQFTFYYSVQPSLDGAMAVAQQILQAGSPEAWFERTREAWQQWLDSGRSTVETEDPGVNQAFTRNLIVLRQCQQPEFGSFVASTNPAYGYKVWPRDGTISALSLDAAGYHEQAEKFLLWMAEVQEEGGGNAPEDIFVTDFPNGTWYTTYGFWNLDEPIDFVQPEWDSVGQFLIGTYHHWRLLNQKDNAAARQFLEEIYPAVVDSAEWIAENVSPADEGGTGFGPPGFSVWEEQYEYAVYTQVTYASGLNAARLLAREMGEPKRADAWLKDAITIRDNMLQPIDSEPCGGMWDPEQQYFIRGIFPADITSSGECEPDTRIDAATDLLWVFGLIAADDPKAQAHRQMILDTLTPPYDLPVSQGEQPDPEQDFGFGIARHEADMFYYSSEYSPGGTFESSVPLPVWPWMSSYMSMAEHWLGMDDLAFARLQWYASVTGVGYMPMGEGVDWNTQQPLVSTMSQPDDGGYNMQIALLNYLGLFDPRLPPLEEGE